MTASPPVPSNAIAATRTFRPPATRTESARPSASSVPYCGDKTPQSPPEICDNGLNIDAYVNSCRTALASARPAAERPTYCGDGMLQKANLEECDNGTANNQNVYGKCQTNCKLGATLR